MPANPNLRHRLKLFYSDHPAASKALAIRGIGIKEWMAPSIVDRPEGTGDYLFMAFHQEVLLKAGGLSDRYPGNTLMVWDKGAGHHYGQKDRTWCHSWIHCDGRIVERLLSHAAIPLNRPIVGFSPALIESVCQAMHHEMTAYREPDRVILENLLHNLVRAIARVSNGKSAPIPQRFVAIRNHIDAHYEDEMTLEGLARLAECSVPHLCSEFKRYFAIAPIDYAIGLRLERARVLLRDQNVSVTAAAAAVGYGDLHHFSKLFRRRYGWPPSFEREKRPALGRG